MNEAASIHDRMTADEIATTVRALCKDEPSLLARLANAASVLFHGLEDLNWAGFYLFDGRELSLGPFHGRPACTRIALGRGVCGKAAAERRTVIVEDVQAFVDHIACDARSRSEIVVPLVRDGALLGVLDVDSPVVARFGAGEKALLETVASAVLDGATRDWVQSGSTSRG